MRVSTIDAPVILWVFAWAWTSGFSFAMALMAYKKRKR